MIVTLTMNPALDLTTSVDRLLPEAKLRCGPARLDPGGGGVNVARVIGALGGAARAILTAGGTMGQAYRERLAGDGLETRAIAIAGETRLNITVAEADTTAQYRLVLPGPELGEAEWRASLNAVDADLVPGGFVVASGSLPPGVPTDFYARIAAAAKRRGACCIIDTSGPALAAALSEGVFLAKPNQREFCELTGVAPADRQGQEQAALDMVRRGAAEIVALTLGAEGAVIASASGLLRIPPVSVEPQSAVGAGDSFVGAFVLALSQGRPLANAACLASAAGVAALLTPGTELCREADVRRIDRALAARMGLKTPDDAQEPVPSAK
ncbi:1-phosphofructokinase family hexose kinase [Aurantimonas coralicida]|uniref:1-phosphofructokinase family hexose kinase n=1 Tax=Aurantimonas coralicida TaxID=182270 RepID=UPI00238E86E4|nr:1-phosphofructokinase family hexose kinase [Aurantimonas coralicida]MDE0922973.1 1-phosphofructokinase family hexose kinase [Aurantimonas coralicida]